MVCNRKLQIDTETKKVPENVLKSERKKDSLIINYFKYVVYPQQQ